MKIQLSEHFTYHKLLRFVFPSIVMMIFTSIYGVVDGLFVSNYAGKTAFAAINLIMPFIMALSALGFMVGTGGSAIVAKTLGEGREKEANRYFSMLIYLTIFGGIILSILGILLARPVSIALGALRRSFRLLYSIWAHYVFIVNTVYAAKCISVLFCHGGKTKTWFTRCCSCRCYEHGAGLSVYRRVWHGACRCRHCNRLWRMYRRLCTINLFCCQKFKSVSFRKNQMVSFYLEKDLYKWLLGIDDKLIQFYRKHLIQFPAYALCRRKRHSCLRNDYVCQFYFCCDLFWIFHRQCPYCQLPLWRTKSQRIKEFIE